MPIFAYVKTGIYYDSITLLNLQKELSQCPGIKDAAVVMGTSVNQAILRQAGLWAEAFSKAGSDDLLMSLSASEEQFATKALEIAEASLKKSKFSSGSNEEYRPRSLGSAAKMLPQANVVLISLPGRFAGAETRKALEQNLHVMLFSDNVPLEQEIELKKLAQAKGLLLMGPDCGTAIIAGTGLGFTNVVRQGEIGIVGASGTGIQELTSLIHNYGGGISHAIGTGGRDLSLDVGAITMLQGITGLQSDPLTKVMVLISKPPHPTVMAKVLEQANLCNKPVIIHFLGATSDQMPKMPNSQLIYTKTLLETALTAVLLSQNKQPVQPPPLNKALWQNTIQHEKGLWKPGQRYFRGLYSGGTLAYEALYLLKKSLGKIYSNLSKDPEYRLKDPSKSIEHSIIDLGEDEYTVGRPHPMIDNTFRGQRLSQEAQDPEVALIMLDIVLGHGSQKDPLSVLLPRIQKAQEMKTAQGQHLTLIAYVCGTDLDPQNKADIEAKLKQQGVLVPHSNVEASQLASALLS